jgi:catalase
MAFTNQGSRPNYPSTVYEMKFQQPVLDSTNHTIWVGNAVRSLSQIDPRVDWDWPRQFVREYPCVLKSELLTLLFCPKVNECSENDVANLISNIAGHLSGVKVDEIKKRQLDVFANVTPKFAEAIAKAMNYAYTPPS